MRTRETITLHLSNNGIDMECCRANEIRGGTVSLNLFLTHYPVLTTSFALFRFLFLTLNTFSLCKSNKVREVITDNFKAPKTRLSIERSPRMFSVGSVLILMYLYTNRMSDTYFQYYTRVSKYNSKFKCQSGGAP